MLTSIIVAKYNISTVRLEEHLESLETKLYNKDIVGMSETRVGGETANTAYKLYKQIF